MRIALDAMGTDNPPGPEVEGAVLASLNSDVEVILVGDEDLLKEKLEAFPKKGNVSIRHAPEAITPLEPPVIAVRKKKHSSMHVALRMVKEGEAQAFISAGNTGAIMVAARVILGSIPGVARPALSQTFPTLQGRTVVLDLGANVDCTARHLCEFAEMGVAYSRHALGVENPRIALLNIGEENVKGGAIAREAYRTLSQASHLNVIGNIEPRPLCEGKADVVVCDGIEHILPVPAAFDQLALPQARQLVADRRNAHVQQVGQVADAQFLLVQRVEDAETRAVAHDLEEAGRVIEHLLALHLGKHNLNRLLVNQGALAGIALVHVHPPFPAPILTPCLLRVKKAASWKAA